jgi:hypothetical protein
MFDPDVWVLFMLFCNTPMIIYPFIYLCTCRLSHLWKTYRLSNKVPHPYPF